MFIRYLEYVDIFSLFFPTEVCKDHAECIEYPVSSCNKEWMKINCRDKCGLCGGKRIFKGSTTKKCHFAIFSRTTGIRSCAI